MFDNPKPNVLKKYILYLHQIWPDEFVPPFIFKTEDSLSNKNFLDYLVNMILYYINIATFFSRKLLKDLPHAISSTLYVPLLINNLIKVALKPQFL